MHQRIKPVLPYLLSLLLIVFAAYQAADILNHKAVAQDLEQSVATLQAQQTGIERLIEAREASSPVFAPPSMPTPALIFIPDPEIPLAAELQIHTFEVSGQHKVPYNILMDIMAHESGYHLDATGYNRNGTYDSGLMQINSVNHAWLLDKHQLDVTDPRDNIEAAAVILSGYLERYTMRQALAAYAAGEAGMLNGGGMWFADEILGEQIESEVQHG